MRLFKGRLTPCLRKAQAVWQPGFYDHRIRESEDLLAVFLYIYLNSYREKLCRADAKWPGYYCSPEEWLWFGKMTSKDCPEPAWLR